MNWPRAMLTDSGGFQMVSLLKLSTINEQGVTFISPFDGTTSTCLTPEVSIKIQNSIGADIIMQLDDVVSSLITVRLDFLLLHSREPTNHIAISINIDNYIHNYGFRYKQISGNKFNRRAQEWKRPCGEALDGLIDVLQHTQTRRNHYSQ